MEEERHTHHRGNKMSIMNRKDEISKQWIKISPHNSPKF